MRGRHSLLAALFGRAIVLVMLIVAVIGALTFWSAREQIWRSYDSTLITGANVLYALMGEELQITPRPAGQRVLEVDDGTLLSAEDRAAFNQYAHDRMFRIWRNNELALGSDIGPTPVPPGKAPEGFFNQMDGAATWRVYRLPVREHGIVIEVGEQLAARGALVHRIALELAIPLLLLIPAAAGLMWLTLADGLGALRAFSRELRRRSYQDLSEIDARRWPVDLMPLIHSTNQLFQRLSAAFHQQRRFIDQAAHQLRTPLATIQLQTQLIARETDAAQSRLLAAQLEASVHRAAELTDRLLTLARLEAATGGLGVTDLAAETTAAIADLAKFAESRTVALAYRGVRVMVAGDATLVRLIAANLIENAIAHSPPDAEVDVSVAADDAGVHLRIEDAGPGIPEAQREQVFKRFYRGGNEPAGGAGLGLSIVAEAARVLGATVSLGERGDGGTGLRATVTFTPV
ncbi:MAG TPA: ATP-binding protein [Steroidobacteraceae bacterium]|nr:ATP-binding protein [Steroidobacteraceae bacterium]